MGGTEAPCSGCWWSWIHHSSLGTPMSGSLVTREMTRGAWGPIVRDEESTDGHPQPQQTPQCHPLVCFPGHLGAGGGAGVLMSSHFISWWTGPVSLYSGAGYGHSRDLK